MDTSFMQHKFSIDQLISHYLEEIRALRTQVQSPADETKLQTYYQAVNVFKNVSIKELVQFALSFGRHHSTKSAQMRNAFPTLLGNRVVEPSMLDVAYAELLLAYAKAFKAYRQNLAEWLLRFVISSRFSPLSGLVEREIDEVIANTQRKIQAYCMR